MPAPRDTHGRRLARSGRLALVAALPFLALAQPVCAQDFAPAAAAGFDRFAAEIARAIAADPANRTVILRRALDAAAAEAFRRDPQSRDAALRARFYQALLAGAGPLGLPPEVAGASGYAVPTAAVPPPVPRAGVPVTGSGFGTGAGGTSAPPSPNDAGRQGPGFGAPELVVVGERDSLSGLLIGAGALGAAGVGAALAFAGTGGGGAVLGGVPSTSPPVAPPVVVDPATFETAEYNAQYGLGTLGASSAYARGGTGEGVIVAVLDSGVASASPELSARLLTTGHRDTLGNDDSPDPDQTAGFFRSHGTAVAGVIAAQKNGTGPHGVAFDARILSLRAFSNQGNGTGLDIAEAFEYLRQVKTAPSGTKIDVRVLNGSFGGSSASAAEGDALVALANAGIVLVFATGNDSNAEPSFPAAYPALGPGNTTVPGRDYTNLRNRLIAVTATDRTNAIAGFANRCGQAAQWCLAAPGVEILAPEDPAEFPGGTDARTVDGTSFAAPHVAGAAAVLIDLFPTLTPDQVVALILNTATDLGAPGVDPVFGRGLVNLRAAAAPAGATTVALTADVAGPASSLPGTGLTGAPALGPEVIRRLGALSLGFLDGYGRDYGLPLGAVASVGPASFDSLAALGGFGRPGFSETLTVDGVGTVSFSLAGPGRAESVEAPWDRDGAGLAAGRLVHPLDPDTRVTLSLGTDPARAFGLTDGSRAGGAREPLDRRTDGNPYLALAADGAAIALERELGGGVALRMGVFTGERAPPVAEAPRDGRDDGAVASGFVVELAGPVAPRARLALSAGALVEDGAALGARGTGALALGGVTPTAFGGAELAITLDPRTTLAGSLHVGATEIRPDGGSLVAGAETITSAAWSLGLARGDVLLPGDRLSLTLSQPLASLSGRLTLDLPGARTGDRIARTRATIDLAPSARELAAEAAWAWRAGPATDIAAGLMWRHNPDHDATAPDEALGVVRLEHRF